MVQGELDRRGIGLIGVSYDPPEVLRQFASAKGIRFPLLANVGSRVISELGLLDSDLEAHHAAFGIQTQEHQLGVAFPGLRDPDPSRPVVITGFLPTSSAARLSQWLRTRDQGDSLAVAARLSDTVGIDYYPCHALAALGPRTLYLQGEEGRSQRSLLQRVLKTAHDNGKRVMVSEGQAEPWETVTTPYNPKVSAPSSCPPQHLIHNFNSAMTWLRPPVVDPLYAYLFWGAEYWLLRNISGDSSYLGPFARIVEEA